MGPRDCGTGLPVVWENTRHSGFIITDFGNIIKFTPAVEEVEMNIMDVLVLGAVAVSVPGVILGLIYMNSPWMQRKYSRTALWEEMTHCFLSSAGTC